MGELTLARPDKIKAQPRPIRLYAYVTEEEHRQIREAADLAGMKVSVFIRQVALAQQIRPAKSRQAQELVQTLSKMGADLNRVGNNLNQLAHQANAAGYETERIHYEETLDEIKAVTANIIAVIKGI